MSNIQNIIDTYNKATNYEVNGGKCWYKAAKQECLNIAKKHGVDINRVIFSVAALSPQLKWEVNIKTANSVIEGKTRIAGVYPANIEKAIHILNDSDDWRKWLSGPKVENFARNISGDEDCVTVDTWAWRIWNNPADVRAKPRKIDHEQVEADYQKAAEILGIKPAELQAVTWVVIRRYANARVGVGQLSLDI